MTSKWFGGTTPPSDPSTFDYEVAMQKVQRQKAAASALQQVGMQGNQGQFVKNGDFIGFAGGNTLGSTIARIAAGALSANTFDKADDAQKQVGMDSQAALSYAMDPMNTPAAKRAAELQVQSEAEAELQRESNRANNVVAGGDTINSPAPVPGQSDAPGAQAPFAPTNAPFLRPGNHVAAKVLAAPVAPPAAAVQSTPTAGGPMPAASLALRQVSNPISATSGASRGFGSGSDLTRTLTPKTTLPTKASGTLSADDVSLFAKLLGDVPLPAADASGTRQDAPQATQRPTSASALPRIAPQPAQQAQAISPQPEAQPAQTSYDGNGPSPAQQAHEVEMTNRQLANETYQGGDSRSMVDQAAASAQPTQAEQIAQLQAIARTGPLGQQMATAQMNMLFGSRNGRYKTTVMADPVNGGFVKVTEDTATGATKTDRIGSPNGTLITGQTTDAEGNRLNVHKDGSTSPMVDAHGKPVVDSAVTARNDEQITKIATAQQSNTTALAAIDTAMARNDRILQLYSQTETGPVLGHLPNLTEGRQELQALLAQDLFAETRNALAGAGEAGGAPRMTQSEFEYMRDNGGLKQTTGEGAATNIIASMNAHLLEQKKALQAFGGRLKTTVPGAAAVSHVPGRGQAVNAAQWGFK